MKNETSKEFGSVMNGFARVMIRRCKGGQFAVVAYVPPGIDLYPIVYGRFENEAAAMPTFNAACADVEKMVGAA
jgi:hypothetical protein